MFGDFISNKRKLEDVVTGLYWDFKKKIKCIEKEESKVSSDVKKAIKNMICSIDNFYAYELIYDNSFYITECVPNRRNAFYVNEEWYIRLLNIVSKRINDDKFEFMFERHHGESVSLFDCIKNIEEISKYDGEENINELLSILENSISKYKIKNALLLLKYIDNIKDYELESLLLIVLKNTSNEKKLKQLYTVLCNNRYDFDNNINKSINCFVNYIIAYKNDDRYDNNLSLIIDKLSDRYTMKEVDFLNNDTFKLLLETNLKNYDNENMDVIIRLLNRKFITSNNIILKEQIINNILEKEFPNELYKSLYISVINNIVFSNDDLNNMAFQQKIVDMLKDIKSTKSLQLILDIYPFIDKYNNNDEKYEVISSISSDDQKVRKLVIPINTK